MPIKDWPVPERPREKLLGRGPGALSDAELLAIFIRSGVPGKTALDVARELLVDLGGLRATLDCRRHRFCRTKGVSVVTFITLQACLELGRRYLESRLTRGEPLATPADTRRYLVSRLRGYAHEVFACLFLDNRNRVLGFEEMFRGTIDGASVHPREIASSGRWSTTRPRSSSPTTTHPGWPSRAIRTAPSPADCWMR